MLYFSVGEVIRTARKRHNLTQEELCYDICAVSTLSKIENSLCTPRVSTFRALMQRMGEPESIYACCLGPESLAGAGLSQETEKALIRRSRNTLESILPVAAAGTQAGDPLRAQLFEITGAAIKWWSGVSAKDILMELREIFDKRGGGSVRGERGCPLMYTRNELIARQMAAGCLSRIGETDRAGKILEDLLTYYGRIYTDEGWFADARITVLYDLADLKMREGQFVLAASFCEGGLRLCAECERLYFLMPLIAQKADIMKLLGNVEESRRAEDIAVLLGGILADKEYLPRFEDYPED